MGRHFFPQLIAIKYDCGTLVNSTDLISFVEFGLSTVVLIS